MIEIPGSNKGVKRDIELKPGKRKPAGAASGPGSGEPGINTVQSSFMDELKAVSLPADGLPGSEDLNGIISEMDRQGRAFQQKPVLEELVKYKGLVKGFLSRTMKALEVTDEKGVRRAMNQKIYKKISIIDEKLNELTSVILDKEGAGLRLMARLDEIRGLLIDLYH
jgi:uncharacterized protein